MNSQLNIAVTSSTSPVTAVSSLATCMMLKSRAKLGTPPIHEADVDEANSRGGQLRDIGFKIPEVGVRRRGFDFDRLVHHRYSLGSWLRRRLERPGWRYLLFAILCETTPVDIDLPGTRGSRC